MLYFLLFLLGVSTSYWEERDFSECEFRGLGISRDGVVILSHGVDSLLETSDMYLWDILYTCGALYVASGDDGRVYRIKEGDGELFFDSGEENVLTLAEHNSYIYAGTSPGGKVYKIDEEGRGEELFDSDEEFIWDLVIKPDGRIIFGTGGNGLVIALGDDRVDTLLYTGRSNASLLKEIDGEVFVGTGDGALLFLITRDERVRGIYDGGEGEITDIVKRGEDFLFLHCMDTLSILKRIRNDGLIENVMKEQEILKGFSRYKEMLLCASGRRVYRLYDDGKFDVLYEFPGTISAIDDNGLFGLSRFSRLYMLSERKAKEGVMESQSYDAWGVSRWGRLTYVGKGDIDFQTKTGNTEIPDITWDEWRDVSADGYINSPPNRFIRWRATINSGSSYIRSVQVAFLPVNQRPRVEHIDLQFESGGLLFSGLDPDGDDVVFDVYYREIGDEWIILEEELQDTILEVERHAFPDGNYQFKVTVSDIPSNPPEYALTSSEESKVYSIDNSSPDIKIEIKDGMAIVIVEDNMSEIASFEYSENASKFLDIYPEDGIFDEKRERFEIPLKEQTMHLVVRTKDRMDNFSLKKWVK